MLTFKFKEIKPNYNVDILYSMPHIVDYERTIAIGANRAYMTKRYTKEEFRDIIRYVVENENISYTDVPRAITLEWLNERGLLPIYRKYYSNKVVMFDYIFPEMYFPWDYYKVLNRKTWTKQYTMRSITHLLDNVLKWDNDTVVKYFDERILKIYGMGSLLRADIYTGIEQLIKFVYPRGLSERNHISNKITISNMEKSILDSLIGRDYKIPEKSEVLLLQLLLKNLMTSTNTAYKDLPKLLDDSNTVNDYMLRPYMDKYKHIYCLCKIAYPEYYNISMFHKTIRDKEMLISIIRHLVRNVYPMDRKEFELYFKMEILEFLDIKINKSLIETLSREELIYMIYH